MTIAPLPAPLAAVALALVSVYAPAALGVLAVLCIAAHVLLTVRDAYAHPFVDASDVGTVAPPVDSWTDEVSAAVDACVADGPLATYAIPVRPSRPQSPCVARTARLAFDCQQSARDAAIHCRVACTIGDRATAIRWRDVAIGLASEAASVAESTQSPHAWRWHAGAVEASRDCSERIATRFAPLLLTAAPTMRMPPPRSIRRGRGGRFVRASEAAS